MSGADASEALRLAALYRYDVLDTPPEEAFDRITRLARMVLQLPIVLVSLIDRERQWFKSRQGLAATETPRSMSFCTHAIQRDVPMIVQDACADPRFQDNPLVVGDPGIRFYLGVPLRTPDGHNSGPWTSTAGQAGSRTRKSLLTR
jgi:GAF domain-containing protein